MKSIFLNFKTTYFRLFEWLRVVFLYYRKLSFLWTDLLLGSQYLWQNPHQVSKTFLKRQGAKNVYGYGETPLTTLDLIARKSRILSKDIVYELGCGSGRTLFWLHFFVRCRAVGIDFLPKFIQKARWVQQCGRVGEVEFRQENFLQADLRKATVIYLYGTCLEDKVIAQLCERFSQLKAGTKIISVSYPLTDYSPNFKVIDHFSARFPWGRAEVYINCKVDVPHRAPSASIGGETARYCATRL